MENIYKLISENLTNLGGPMGSEYTYNNFVKYFDSIKKAKEYAEKDYGKAIPWMDKETEERTIAGNIVLEPGDIIIVKDKDGNEKEITSNFHNTENIYSGDLSYVMYHIKPIEVN